MQLVILEKATNPAPSRNPVRHLPTGQKRKGHIAYTRRSRSGTPSLIPQKGSVRKVAKPNPYHKIFGKYQLDKFPSSNVPMRSIEKNFRGNLNTHWVLRWKDETGKTQHAYTKKFLENKKRDNFQSVRRMAKAINKLREVATRDFRSSRDEKERVSALIVLLIDKMCFRIGSEDDVRRYGSYGVSTLRVGHVKLKRNAITFSFMGKKGVDQKHILVDTEIARAIRGLMHGKKRNENLFTRTRESTGTEFPVTEADVRAYMSEVVSGVTPKDLRTYHATRLCNEIADKLWESGSRVPVFPDEKKSRKYSHIQMTKIFSPVAKHLGHDTATLLRSYCDDFVKEKVIDFYAQGIRQA